ncbi:hypothetical protein AY601_1573 [Pedobacter cryoconitis]|uniref:Uncharacterized protein n=1 Tax=Pedobacter cryoconitis TaxID=188932 RepID=A0A127VBW2_9SPHI|nr:hypothetical protein [Pedobacter cryoconitis]AMP98488.1 hypothetical protein AY601_1573 [Pedobacter cryoconitis]
MQTSELRIGNYVKTLSGNDPVKVESISTKGINSTIGTEAISPVLITEEWLVNDFGFKDNGQGYYQHPEFNFFLYNVVEDEYFDCYKQVPANDETGDFKTLQHVHKLQNLFFELFEEELTSKD